MTEAIIGVLFAAGGVSIYFILKDAFSRDQSGKYKITKGFYRKWLSLEGHGSLLTFSAFSRSSQGRGMQGLPKAEGMQQSRNTVEVADAGGATKK